MANEVVEHTSGRFRASRHKFVIQGVIDADVVSEQSRKQLALYPNETIIVHHHKQDESCDTGPHDAYGTSVAAALVELPEA
jgi:hypothetical protein